MTKETAGAHTQTIFVNIFAAIKAEKIQRTVSFNKGLDEYKTMQDILNVWSYRDLIPKGKLIQRSNVYSIKGIETVEALKLYLVERRVKADLKAIDSELLQLQTIEKAGDIESVTVSVEWKPSRMWGNNPTAEGRFYGSDGFNSYKSGSISGCGFDKGSTAVADVLNQSNALLKALYMVKEQNINTINRDLFGYGSGYGIKPYFEGGVGVSCYNAIFNKIGFNFNCTASGKRFDVYSVSRVAELVTA